MVNMFCTVTDKMHCIKINRVFSLQFLKSTHFTWFTGPNSGDYEEYDPLDVYRSVVWRELNVSEKDISFICRVRK
jgi:hypothetical protein